MRFFVHCDDDGKILSVTKVHTMHETLAHPYVHAEGEKILEIDADLAVSGLDAHEVVEQYAVDISTGTLRRHPGREIDGGGSAPSRLRTTTKKRT